MKTIITSVNTTSTKQIMLNDQAACAEIIMENMKGYVYHHLYYCLDEGTNEIMVLVDGETYITAQVNDS